MSKVLYESLNAPFLKDILKDIKEVCDFLGISFFGVGAIARNIWYIQNDKHSRGTKDIDFGVHVANEIIYNKFKNKLVEEYRYKRVESNAFCLISPKGTVIDLLPFGEIENEGKVLIEGKGLVSINLDGFKEAYEFGLVEANIEEDTIKVCSIPSVILLKLIAFDDRPENRPNDPIDINSILSHYPLFEDELIWDEYNFLYKDEEKEHDEVGVEVLGYEISKMIIKNSSLRHRILEILEKAINSKSKLAELMIRDANTETIQMKITLLKSLKKGIIDGVEKYS